MKPNKKLITISDNETKIKALLKELVLEPRVNALKWSAITKQTPNMKIGYPGQHLASLITGMCGERTGARGNDLIDGSEVKSCSRIDQLDQCKDCKAPVSRSETNCPSCNSTSIIRRDDSKWLFTIKNESDLNVLTNEVSRVLLVIGDYPNFEKHDFDTLQFRAFEIWTHSPRNMRFGEIMTNYYKSIYLAHKENNAAATPAPKNFWPYSYQFYLCNPILTFSCIVKNANTAPKITIEKYLDPFADRTNVESPIMPVEILTELELDKVIQTAERKDLMKMLKSKAIPNFDTLKFKEKKALFIGIDEKLRSLLPLRDTDKIATAKTLYKRRGASI